MPPPPSYLDITSLPYSHVITQAEFNGGTFGGVANEVWFRYIAAADTAFGGYTNSGGTFTPKTFIYQSDGTTELHHITGALGWYYVLPAATYYIKIIRNGGGASDFDFTATNQSAPLNPSLPDNAIIINDDESGFPATAWQTDGTFLGVLTQFPAGEIGDALPTGESLWQDRFGTLGAVDSLALFDSTNTYVTSVTTTPAFSGFPLIAHSDTLFYVVNRATGAVSTISTAGVVTDGVATLAAGDWEAFGVTPDGTIGYWAEGTSSNVIHAHDLVTNTPLPDLYTITAIAGSTGEVAITAVNNLPGEILVLSNGHVVTWYNDYNLNTYNLIEIDAAGTLVTSAAFSGSYRYIDHIHYAADSPDAIVVWFFETDTASAARIGHFVLATSTLDVGFDIDLNSAGVSFGAEVFVPSASCTMVTHVYVGITTGSIQVVKVTDPPGSDQSFSFDATNLDPIGFTLQDGDSQLYTDLTPGSGYGVIEAVPAGWAVAYEVSNASPVDNISVSAGELVTVTVTNTQTATPSGSGVVEEFLIRRERWFPVINDEQVRLFFSFLQIDLQAGNGITTGQGSDPILVIDWSDDGGWTWSNEHEVSSGPLGAYQTRVFLYNLGQSRQRVYRIACTDPVQWCILNAYMQVVKGLS